MVYKTRQEAAEYLRISQRTFDTLISQGRIPRYKISKQRVLFRQDDLDEYVENNLVDSDQPVCIHSDPAIV